MVVKRALRQAASNLPQTWQAKLWYYRAHGRLPDLSQPRRFTERVFAQNLSPNHARFAELADKVRVKDHVRRTLGPGFVVPTIWHGRSLPPRDQRWPAPFVLKANHGSGLNRLVRSERDLDWDSIEQDAARWLRTSWPESLQEGWYNEIERQLLVEPLLSDGPDDLTDYKVLVFSWRAKLVQVDTVRFSNHACAFYDPGWVRQPFEVAFPMQEGLQPRPRHLAQMLDAAEKLAQGFEFVRIDFYDLPEGPVFGEMTFSPGAGLVPFRRDEHDLAMGRLWEEGESSSAAHPSRHMSPEPGSSG